MKKFLTLILISTFFFGGCVIKFGSQQAAGVRGIFKSADKGNTWQAKNLFLYSGGVGNIGGADIISINFDPQDIQAIYLNTSNGGLFYSYDGGESWMKAKGLEGNINSVAIDPKNKCVIYATRANTVVKSVDCSRSWSEVYIDTRTDKLITSLVIDHYDHLTVYAGNSSGEVLRSENGGGQWQVIKRLGDKVVKFLMSPDDSRIIYAATAAKGIFKTTDGGASWNSINDGLSAYTKTGALTLRDLIFSQSQNDSLMLVSKYGLIKTNDGGLTWEPLNLITPPGAVDILAAAINPKNSKEIYYSTASTFYKTTDGGNNWITKRLPSSAWPSVLLVHPQDTNVIFMGLTNPQTKK